MKLESMVDTDRQPLILSSLVDTLLVSHAERAAQQQIQLSGEGIAGLPEISGHPAQMLRALQEILRNALQHTEPGGRVTVSGQVEAAQVVITITDTGSGISAEHIPRVFDRFYRVEQYRPLEDAHTGLGLSIAKKVIELHGGTITLDSAIQQGTTVKITLPVTPPG
ncbi:MAG: sensor histidine kinase [Chloroflexota bacterium]|nr:sensor histidine kinase [Chloroflexota bacterium]